VGVGRGREGGKTGGRPRSPVPGRGRGINCMGRPAVGEGPEGRREGGKVPASGEGAVNVPAC
jgi:hypothetical protein